MGICWELLLRPDIGLYRRAMTNLLIAKFSDHDQFKHAEECVDLLDLLKEEQGGSESEKISEIRQLAEDIADSNSTLAVTDPATGLSSDPIDGIERLNLDNGGDNDDALAPEGETDSENEGETDSEDEGEIIYDSRLTFSLRVEDKNLAKPFVLEEYLRDADSTTKLSPQQTPKSDEAPKRPLPW